MGGEASGSQQVYQLRGAQRSRVAFEALPQFTVLPVVRVAQASRNRCAEESTAMAVQSQAFSSDESASSVANPTLRQPRLVLRLPNRWFAEHKVQACARSLGASMAQRASMAQPALWSCPVKAKRQSAPGRRTAGFETRRPVTELRHAPRGFVVHVCCQARSTTRTPQ